MSDATNEQILSLLKDISTKLGDLLLTINTVGRPVMEIENYFDIHTMLQKNKYGDNNTYIIDENNSQHTTQMGIHSPSLLSDEQRTFNLAREYKKVSKLHEHDINRTYPVCMYNSKSGSYYIDRYGYNQDNVRCATRNAFIYFHNEWEGNVYPIYSITIGDMLSLAVIYGKRVELSLFTMKHFKDYDNLAHALNVGIPNITRFVQNVIDSFRDSINVVAGEVASDSEAVKAIDYFKSFVLGTGLGITSVALAMMI